ncbi:MAG: M28 family metallopeptidase [Lentisphaeria bacterium]|jgi:hypothetical protein
MNLGKASTSNILADLRTLTETIGARLAGSPQEKEAVDFLCERFRQNGAQVTVEGFPTGVRDVTSQNLEIEIGGQWQSFPASLFSSVPGTDGKTLEAPIVFFAGPVDYQRQDFSWLRGKAVVHLSCHIESRSDYRRLIEADPAFLLFVDIRYPGVIPLADGMFPAYTRAIGAKPTMNVAYMDAWRWQQAGATRARLRVDGGMRPGQAANVIAELPGAGTGTETIYVGAHHDTQADTPGGDDNASGTVILLEIARLLAERPRRRTIRLIAFGAEEQLSVGSASYVRRHRAEVERDACFMLNFDSCGAALGWYEINGNGPAAMFELMRTAFRKHNREVKITENLVPYTDQFPFLVCGVPGVWVSRRCCTAGRFWHHRRDDDLRHLDPAELALQAELAASVLDSLANAPEMPFDRTLPAAQKTAALAMWDDLYGGFTP